MLSVGAPGNFNNVFVDFVRTFVQGLDIGKGAWQSRVAVATFSSTAGAKAGSYAKGNAARVDFNFADNGSMEGVLAALGKITYPQGSTYTSAGLQQVRDAILPTRRKGTGVRTVLVLLTDGAAATGFHPGAVAKKIRDAGVAVYAIGVKGSGGKASYKLSELALTASAPSKDHVMETSFETLGRLGLASDLAAVVSERHVCSTTTTTTATTSTATTTTTTRTTTTVWQPVVLGTAPLSSDMSYVLTTFPFI